MVNPTAKNSAEQNSAPEAQSAVNKPSHAEDLAAKELGKTTEKFASSAQEKLGGVEGNENVEFVDGEISEVMATTKEQKGGTFPGSGTAMDPAQIKANLLKSIPSEREMRHMVEKEIKKEIKYLHRKAIRLVSAPGTMSPFEMNNIMKKIRSLRSILKDLAKASVETLKTLWLRFVHGVL